MIRRSVKKQAMADEARPCRAVNRIRRLACRAAPFRLAESARGEVAEWFKAAVLKTPPWVHAHRGFEIPPLSANAHCQRQG